MPSSQQTVCVRERERVCYLTLSSHTGLNQMLPGHPLAGPRQHTQQELLLLKTRTRYTHITTHLTAWSQGIR